ncbi:MAG: hypothetical protein ABIK09_05340, partial [Pseudomonadota bacterium]
EAAVRLTQAGFTAAGIPSYVEQSGGGKGWHLWVFFSGPTPAKLVRQLAHRLIPSNLPLAGGRGVAMPRSNRGVETFPKTAKAATPKRLGNLVWLPWFHGASGGANEFYREEDGTLVPYTPGAFETIDQATIEQLLADLEAAPTAPASPTPSGPRTHVEEEALEEFLRRATKEDDARQPPSTDWRTWKEKALALLDLERVYGHWLTGERAGEHWLQCQDPDSPSGADSKSGNVADGTGTALRGTFHSWRTEETLSVFDFMVHQGQATSFLDAARQIAEWTGVPLPERAQLPIPATPPPSQSSYPVIVVNNRQTRDIRYEAEGVLVAANATDPFLYIRARRPVRIVLAEGDPHVSEVDSVVMYQMLAQVANWVRRTDEGDSDVPPLQDMARMLVASPPASLPLLDGVTTAPIFDAAGHLVRTPGFHHESGVWYYERPGFSVPPVPDNPTQKEIDAARTLLLDELIVDFPFVSSSDRAHAVAALILPFIRRMVIGPTPIHLYEAPTPGSGKTLAAEVVCLIATGEAAEPTTLPQDDEEARKKITSLLLAARSVVLLDNVRGGIDSVNLAAVLTAEKWTDRLLGGNDLAGLPNRAVWLVSANNPTLTLEIARRCIRIRVEPAAARPWERKNFKHWPLKHWVLDNRAALVHAVLTLVQAWISRGRPPGMRTLGSFEHWASTIGGILDVAGIPGFLENADELFDAADLEGQEWREFTAAWWREHGATPVTAKALLLLATGDELLPYVLGGKNERSQAIRLGKGLMANRNRIYGDYRIMAAHVSHNQRLWRLEHVEDHTADSDAGDDPSQTRERGMLLPFERDIPLNIPLRKPASNLAAGDVGDVGDVKSTLAEAGGQGRTHPRVHDAQAHIACGGEKYIP